ncbi:two-component sensor histidine kinase [Gracilibacillus boraciitolerans JCM 21714]|uniref:Two-component sensor histidine kinase n=1 Tax=Gracilibacillus boraciitolerans JCM 21714 TaxID=1298598 RepID=W4VIS6_9BACI|nr:HAMP domain-containing protein [Gracilibacillus boraciitolerans]GAE93112.1 two-component sensor histidine kinase [Gracilibacillus boraciitolerans JCM 21714]
MKIIKKIPYNSISFKLITTILIMTIPLILLLIYSNTYASQVVRSQVASSYQNIMESYMNQLDRDLENTNMYIHNMIALDDNFLSIEQSRSDADYSMAKILFVNDLKQQLPLYSVIDAFWVYKISKQDLISVYNYRPAYTKQLDINSYFIDYLENNWSNESGTYKWQSHKIGEKYYIAYFIKRGDVYFGAWIDLNRLNSRIEISDLGPKSGSWFISSDGNIMANQWGGLADNQIKEKISTIENLSFENSEDAVIIREKSVNSDTSLVSAIPNETILENIPLLQRMSWMLIVLSLFVIPVCLYIIRKIILIPIYRLVKAMKHIQNNNLNYRISEYKSADEYILMNKTFNRMLSQIEQLKIDVYEEKINKQHEELQHLKLQINPHFFFKFFKYIV